MITGPNAAGKTSFFRVLSGLWPLSKGSLSYPERDVQLVPQRVYSVVGSFSDQVTYPAHIAKDARTPEDEQKMKDALSKTGKCAPVQYLFFNTNIFTSHARGQTEGCPKQAMRLEGLPCLPMCCRSLIDRPRTPLTKQAWCSCFSTLIMLQAVIIHVMARLSYILYTYYIHIKLATPSFGRIAKASPVALNSLKPISSPEERREYILLYNLTDIYHTIPSTLN